VLSDSIAQGKALGATNSEVANVQSKADETHAEERRILGLKADMVNQNWRGLTDPSDVEEVSKRLAEDYATQQGLTRIQSQMLVARKAAYAGHDLPWLNKEMAADLRSGDGNKMAGVAARYDAVALVSPMAATRMLSPPDRALMNSFTAMSQQTSPETAAKAIKEASPHIAKARASLNGNRIREDTVNPKLVAAGLTSPGNDEDVMDYAAVQIALGVDTSSAIDAAIIAISDGVNEDEHGIAMSRFNYVAGWEERKVRDRVRETHLRAWLVGGNIDPDGLFGGAKMDVQILPTPNGEGLLVSNGALVGVAPLSEWTKDAKDNLLLEENAERQAEEAAADAQRVRTQNAPRRSKKAKPQPKKPKAPRIDPGASLS